MVCKVNLVQVRVKLESNITDEGSYGSEMCPYYAEYHNVQEQFS